MRRIGFVLYPGFQMLDFAGPAAAFDVANAVARRPLYECVALGTSRELAAVGGMTIKVDLLRNADAGLFNTLIIAGGPGASDPSLAQLMHEDIARFQRPSARIASVCTGALILGRLGFLDHRQCTTHWAYADQLARIAPLAKVAIDRIFVEDQDVWTSAGMTAGIDMALAMIKADHGAALTREVSRSLVVYFRRPGGQSQFSHLVESQSEDPRIERAHAWVMQNLARPLRISEMAAAAGLSERQFSRIYRALTGMTPAKGIERLRVERARALFEAAPRQVQQIARECGFGTSETMRSAFRRHLGLPPQFVKWQ